MVDIALPVDLKTIKKRNYTSYILDADIQGFFDHIDHEWAVKFVESRIKDPNIIRLLRRMLKAGIMKDYTYEETEEGSGQGSVCSPIIANIYMQNDFIDGSLGTKEAEAIVPAVIEKIKEYPSQDVYATRDTHPADYLDTQEGRYLPVEHCIKGTPGWQIRDEISELIPEDHIFDKPTFGSVKLAETARKMNEEEPIEIELVGLCTDICVVSNALLLKAFIPEVRISVDSSGCAGVTPEKHMAGSRGMPMRAPLSAELPMTGLASCRSILTMMLVNAEWAEDYMRHWKNPCTIWALQIYMPASATRSMTMSI